MSRRFVRYALVAVMVAACSSGRVTPGPVGSGGSGGPGLGASPMTAGELRLAIMDRFGPRWWCDTDFYPIAHDDEQVLALQRFAAMQAEGDVFAAAVGKLGLAGATSFTDAQKVAIYQLWKAASSFPFEAIGNGRYRFDYVAEPAAGQQQGVHVEGTITEDGEVAVEQQAAAGQPNCPICLARGTPIDTPTGPIAVEALRLGDPIWTFDAVGRRVAGTVIAVGSTPAPAQHRVVRIVLADGRTASVSPGHPLPDGGHAGEIRAGDVLDGSRVASADWIAYEGDATFDLVASGATGGYFAGGIPMLSTLGR